MVKPFHVPCPGQIPSCTCPASPHRPSLIKESLLPRERCGKVGLHVHTNFALTQTVNKGSSQLRPLFILIVTVYYEQNYIPKLILHRLRKKCLLSTAQPLLGLSLAEVRGGDAAAQLLQKHWHMVTGEMVFLKLNCRAVAELDIEASFQDRQSKPEATWGQSLSLPHCQALEIHRPPETLWNGALETHLLVN